MKKVPLIVVLGSILIAAAAQSAITVTNLNDSGAGSLRQAIADAAPGDTIDFAVTGTITLTSGQLVIDKDLTISGPGATNLTVSGNNASRVFNIPTVTAVVMISDLMIANGRNADEVNGTFGGGIANSSSLTISNCIITANTNIFFCCGGGGIVTVGPLTIVNSTISKNHGGYGGGGISIGSGGSSVVRLENCLVSENGAVRGGGIENYGNLTAINTTVSGNFGGGIVDWNSMLNLDSCTVSSNSGQGIRSEDGSVLVRNSIIAGNNASLNPDFNGTLNSLDYNLIQNTNGAAITGVTAHNIYDLDPLLGPLADNGGPTLTHALLPGSPALDAGQSGGLTTDQRGFPRPVDNAAVVNASGGDGSDIGAYEACAETNLVTNTNDSGPGSLRQAILAANACPGQNIIEFAPSAFGTITLTTGELVITDDLTINGPGVTNLIVSGNHESRVISKRFSTMYISNVTIADGYWDGYIRALDGGGGGGIENAGGYLSLSNCVIANCTASKGGGIASFSVYSSGAYLDLKQCTIIQNAATWGVGGGRPKL